MLKQIRIDEDVELRVVAERRNTADRKPGGLANPVGIDALTLCRAGSGGKLLLIEHVRARHVCQHQLQLVISCIWPCIWPCGGSSDAEDQALHDLTDCAPDRIGGILSGLGSLGIADRDDINPERPPSLDDFDDVSVRLVRHRPRR